MKAKYTKQQILETIKHWKNKLNESYETLVVPCKIDILKLLSDSYAFNGQCTYEDLFKTFKIDHSIASSETPVYVGYEVIESREDYDMHNESEWDYDDYIADKTSAILNDLKAKGQMFKLIVPKDDAFAVLEDVKILKMDMIESGVESYVNPDKCTVIAVLYA